MTMQSFGLLREYVSVTGTSRDHCGINSDRRPKIGDIGDVEHLP
jgi:hypothetical protein